MKTEWHLFDAKKEVLGRLASQTARLLLGKHRPDYAPHKVAPVFVVVTNTDQVKLTGRKEAGKLYRHYSGYPGGLKKRTAGEQRQRDSRRIIREAVFGMLPKNKLRALRLRHLKTYRDAQHPHVAQIK